MVRNIVVLLVEFSQFMIYEEVMYVYYQFLGDFINSLNGINFLVFCNFYFNYDGDKRLGKGIGYVYI